MRINHHLILWDVTGMQVGPWVKQYWRFLSSLLNNAFSVTKTTQHQMKGQHMKDELERMWQEEVVT
jgi:hypothetical protein